MQLSLWALIKGQFAKLPPVAKADLTGKTVIVLGANTGLGFEAAKHFARMGAGRVILACRSQSRGQAALERLRAETGSKNVELWIVDLADFASVKRFADKFEQDGGRLDILVENAAIATLKHDPTKDGWETALQVNCISTPLVAFLLLPHMMRTAQTYNTVPRIAVVASEVHYFTKIPKKICDGPDGILATLGSTAFCTPKVMRSYYMLTKLLNVLFVRAVNARLEPDAPLIITAINPGFCISELRRGISGFMVFISSIMERILAFTTEEGSRQLVFGAVGHPENPDALRGAYINQCRVEEPSDFAISPLGQKAQDRVWDELVEILGKVDPRVLQTVDQYLTPKV
ncbi:hypothetical protein FB451DRAFT_1483837 [Mycena latifolia]|nr:hypothetical protein FB451DRAFT_1483837 [Mycena latifolia]